MKSNHKTVSGLKLSRIGLGTAQLANTDKGFQGVKHIPTEVARSILEGATKGGISFFDTGINYGTSETLMAELKRKTGNKVSIGTKIGLSSDGVRDFSKDILEGQVMASLNRLGVDQFDLLQLNKPSIVDLETGLLDRLQEYKQRGLARSIGLVVGDTNTGHYAIKDGRVDTLQVMYHLMYADTRDLIQAAYDHGIRVIIRSPLNSGMLAGVYTKQQSFDVNDERSSYFQGKTFNARLEILDAILLDLNLKKSELLGFALRYIFSHRGVDCVIPGASSVAQLESYVAAGQQMPFTNSDLQNIQKTIQPHLERMRTQSFQN